MYNDLTMTGLNKHHFHRSGEIKSVCVSHVLAHFGISPDAYHYTGRAFDNRRESILRRHGWAVRSRKSAMGKANTVGQIRDKIRKLNDPEGTVYMVVVVGHAMLLDASGKTIVDTAPRKRDARKVLQVKAVFKV